MGFIIISLLNTFDLTTLFWTLDLFKYSLPNKMKILEIFLWKSEMFTLCLLKVGPINQNFYNSRPDFVDGLKLVKLKVMDNTIARGPEQLSRVEKHRERRNTEH